MRPRSAVITWVTVALLLAAVTLIERLARSDLDDPDPARQRPGLVLPEKGAREAAPVSEDVPVPAGELSRAYGLSRPRDGALPVGYALVDSRKRVRYQSLDPAVLRHFTEIRTLLRSLR